MLYVMTITDFFGNVLETSIHHSPEGALEHGKNWVESETEPEKYLPTISVVAGIQK